MKYIPIQRMTNIDKVNQVLISHRERSAIVISVTYIVARIAPNARPRFSWLTIPYVLPASFSMIFAISSTARGWANDFAAADMLRRRAGSLSSAAMVSTR